MTYLTFTSVPHSRVSFLQIMANFFEKRRENAARKQTVYALNSLGNHALKDLAIDRSEIFSAAYVSPSDRRRGFMQ
ncbi:MAG: DUF1127 domain-containing protein [Rhizobiaceae bacterium]|nr:DUF1127 domain-containing protein [Rhizobiaceae bacterium]